MTSLLTTTYRQMELRISGGNLSKGNGLGIEAQLILIRRSGLNKKLVLK